MTMPYESSENNANTEQFPVGASERRVAALARPTVFVGNLVSQALNGMPYEPDFETREKIGSRTILAMATATLLLVHGPNTH